MLRKLLTKLEPLNPWLIFLPFLGLYLVLALIQTQHASLVMDEVRYWGFADNLLAGGYAFTDGGPFLWSGPGYPIVLVPFAALDAPFWMPKALNAVFLYMAVVYFFRLACLYIPRKKGWVLAFIFACYYPFYEIALPYVMTEALCILLTVLGAYYLGKAFRDKTFSWKKLLPAGLALGYLALTKVIFGYVLLVMLIVWPAWWLYSRRKDPKSQQTQRMLGLSRVFAVSMALCLPYLIYTFSLTGKPFYWSNAGGLQLFWMSSPYADELGDWHMPNLSENDILKAHHQEFFDSIEDLPYVEKDAAFKQKAIENIKAHPQKFAYNWIANLGRTFFSYPNSFLRPSLGIYFYLAVNGPILLFALIMAWLAMRYPRRFPTEMLCMVAFMVIYVGGLSLMASYQRFSYMTIPILLIWIAYGLQHFVRLDLEENNTAEEAGE